MKKYFCVTSMNQKIFDRCGKLALDSYIKYWPNNIPLILYDEDGTLSKYQSNKIQVRTFDDIRPKVKKMKDLGHEKKVVRFSNKAFSWLDAVEKSLGTHLIWLDADVATKDYITESWLDSVVKNNVSTHIGVDFPAVKHDWDSKIYYTCETGFFCLDLSRADDFLNLYKDVYDNPAKYDLRCLYDGDVYGLCVKNFEGKIEMADLNPKKHHTAFSRIILKDKLAHYKGKIKKDIDFNLERKRIT